MTLAQILFTACIVLGSLVALMIYDRVRQRASRLPGAPGPWPGPPALDRRTARLIVLVLLLAAVVLVLMLGVTIPDWLFRWGPRRAKALSSIVTGGVIVGSILATWGWWSQRVLMRAARLARTGEIDSAVELLEDELTHSPSSPQLYRMLASLYGAQQLWALSLRTIEKAERLAGPQRSYLVVKGIALWKLGRLEEAAVILEAAAHLMPRNLLVLCNYGSLLAELGRHEEASNVLHDADHLFASQLVLHPLDRQARAAALDDFHHRVTGQRIEKNDE